MSGSATAAVIDSPGYTPFFLNCLLWTPCKIQLYLDNCSLHNSPKCVNIVFWCLRVCFQSQKKLGLRNKPQASVIPCRELTRQLKLTNYASWRLLKASIRMSDDSLNCRYCLYFLCFGLFVSSQLRMSARSGQRRWNMFRIQWFDE